MGRVLHSERDFSTTFDEINRRLDALEQWSGSVMRALSSVHGGNSVGAPGKIYTNQATLVVIQDGQATPVSDSVTFAAPYAGQYLLLGNVQVGGPSAGNQTASVSIFLDGVAPADAPFLGINVPGVNGDGPVPIIYATTLQAGNHTFDVRFSTGNASTYTVFAFDLYVFALGG